MGRNLPALRVCRRGEREVSMHGQTANTVQSCKNSACSSHGQQPSCTPTPKSRVAPTQSLMHPAAPSVPDQPSALSKTPRNRVCMQQGTRRPCYLFQAFSGQLLPTMRGADTVLQGRREDTEPSWPINHLVHEDNSPVQPSSFQSHSPHSAWAPRLLYPRLQHPNTAGRAGLGSHTAAADRPPPNHPSLCSTSQQPELEAPAKLS